MHWKVGIIGFGFIGKIHALAYQSLPYYYDRMPGRYELAAVATSRPETAEEAGRRFGFQKTTTHWQDLVSDPDIAIIHVAHPNRGHREVLLAAMAAGKHIYCEKPLTADWDEALAVHAALPDYSGISQVCVQNRFQAAMCEAAEKARQGFLGDIVAFRGVYLHSGNVSPGKVLNWKATLKASGGGVINDLAPHLFDMIQVLCGPIKAVSCEKRLTFPDRQVNHPTDRAARPNAEDHAVMMLKLANDAVGSAEVSKACTGKQDELSVTVHGTLGAIHFNLMDPYWLHVYDQRHPEQGWMAIPTGGHFPDTGAVPGKVPVGWMRGHIASLHHFLTGVAQGKPVKPDLADGVQLQGILHSAYRAAESGQWEQVPVPPL